MNNATWIICFEWEEYGETSSRIIEIPQADFSNVSEAVEYARESCFMRYENPGVRRVEDSITLNEVEW